VHHRILDETEGRRTIVAVLEAGEDVVSTLTRLAADLKLLASSVTGVGGFARARLGYFNPVSAQFAENLVDEQVEVLSFNGNIAEAAGEGRKLHIHVVLGRSDATTRGGHLIEGIVSPTMEVVISESPHHLRRRHDPKSGLVLLHP
jgi:uncharacterized protein